MIKLKSGRATSPTDLVWSGAGPSAPLRDLMVQGND